MLRLRSITILGVLLLCAGATLAQRTASGTRFYADLSGGLGYPFAARFTANILFLEHHELALGYAAYMRRGPEVPSDWESGELVYFGIGPQQHYNAACLSYGYAWQAPRQPERWRYLLRAGITYGTLYTPYNFQFVPYNGAILGSDSWTHSVREEPLLAITLNPTVQFTPKSAFGLSAGLYGVFSEPFSGGGVCLGMLLGRLR